jgi:hypothetical protein
MRSTRTATVAALAPFDRSWTTLLTTFKRDGSPVGTPVNLAVEGDHAYFRSYHKAWKTKRIRNKPDIAIAPSTVRGTPTGETVPARARLLSGDEERHARQVIAHHYPVFQRFVIPFGHKVSRHTSMHYEVSLRDVST